MIAALPFLRDLAGDSRGAALIETAVLAPTLIVMCIGGFEVSSIVARQSELQSTAEQAVEIALATSPDTQAELDAIDDILEDSAGLGEARVELEYQYRCGTSTTISATLPTACDPEALSTYIAIEMTDEYQPVWTNWGLGNNLEYAVNRTVQIS